MARCWFAWAWIALGASVGHAAPTDLDPSFGTGGVVSSPAGAASILALSLEPSGDTLVAVRMPVGAGSTTRVIRLDASGTVDTAFGQGGAIAPPSQAGLEFGSMARRPDGRLDVLWRGPPQSFGFGTTSCDRVWGRYLGSGALDASFSTQGTLTLPDFPCCWGHEVDSAGISYRIETKSGYELARHALDGTPLSDIQPFTDPTFAWWTLSIDPADRLVVAMRRRAGASHEFAVGRSGAPAFGNAGIATATVPVNAYVQGAFGFVDGSVVVFGFADAVSPDGLRQTVVVRFTPTGLPDPAFGRDGVVVLPLARSGELGTTNVVARALADGRVLVAAEIQRPLVSTPPVARIALARLRADGQLDTTFARGGVATLDLAPDARLDGDGNGLAAAGTLSMRPDGAFLLPVRRFDLSTPADASLMQFAGGDLDTPAEFESRPAVEYFHAAYGHYFMTADADEIVHLDATPASGWQRTGASFAVYADVAPGATPPLAPVCRFWSDQSFAPKSSHFYSPYAGECSEVLNSATWTFERYAFELRLPVGAQGARDCPAGTVRLYRAYNNMTTGAPNHRYVRDVALLDAMIAEGWTMEGEATTRVFACVPAQ